MFLQSFLGHLINIFLLIICFHEPAFVDLQQVIFAFIPPCTWLGGWLTFFVALMMIGLVTTIVGDLATIFGCLVGLKAEATAILFVALGTSLPDLFASKTAAVNEKYADASVGNVTGSNSVNVFLGLGTPWVIATIYHEVQVIMHLMWDVCTRTYLQLMSYRLSWLQLKDPGAVSGGWGVDRPAPVNHQPPQCLSLLFLVLQKYRRVFNLN